MVGRSCGPANPGRFGQTRAKRTSGGLLNAMETHSSSLDRTPVQVEFPARFLIVEIVRVFLYTRRVLNKSSVWFDKLAMNGT
jgi:hypothetical protein